MATDFRSWAVRQRAPFTLFLVASLVVAALLGWLTRGQTTIPLALTDPGARPWGLLTYPWAYSPLGQPFGLIFLIFFVMWIFQFGGTIEQQMGTARFAAFWLVFTLFPALIAVGFHYPLAEPWLPSSAIVMAWCARNRGASVAFWGIPMSATVLAAIIAASELFFYGAANPVAGIGFVLPLVVAWLFGADRLPLAFGAASDRKHKPEAVIKGGTKYDDAYYENVKKREIEREEQERLRKLFEGK